MSASNAFISCATSGLTVFFFAFGEAFGLGLAAGLGARLAFTFSFDAPPAAVGEAAAPPPATALLLEEDDELLELELLQKPIAPPATGGDGALGVGAVGSRLPPSLRLKTALTSLEKGIGHAAGHAGLATGAAAAGATGLKTGPFSSSELESKSSTDSQLCD